MKLKRIQNIRNIQKNDSVEKPSEDKKDEISDKEIDDSKKEKKE